MQALEKQILVLMENLKRQVRTQPLNLGAVLSPSGGAGGPPGGFIGWLPQTRVAYDISELESSTPTYPPPSGVNLSLLDNLNHIRKRIGTLEGYVVSGGGGGINVLDSGTPVGIAISNVNFGANLSVTLDDPTSVTISGGGGGGGDISVYEDTVLIDDAVTSLDLTNGLEGTESPDHYITLAINQNKIIRRPSIYWAEDPDLDDEYYPATNAGLTSALGDAYDGDTIYLPAAYFTGPFTFPDYITIVGAGNQDNAYYNGTWIDTDTAHSFVGIANFINITLQRSTNVANVLSLFNTNTSYQSLTFTNCYIYVRNSSSNAAAYAYGIYDTYGNLSVLAHNTHFEVLCSSTNTPYILYSTHASKPSHRLTNCILSGDSDVEIVNGSGGYNDTYSLADYNHGVINKNVNFTVESGISRLGNYGEGNYSQFDESGHLQMFGNATTWDDLQMPLIGQRLESPGSNITQNDTEGSLTFDDSCDLSDYVTMSIQLSHRWKEGSDIGPHIHWWQTSSNVPNWLIQYRWQRKGYPKITVWSGLAWNSHAFSYTSGTLNQITDFPMITPPENSGLSDIVQIRVLRDTGNGSTLFAGSDPLTGDSDIVNFDIHMEMDTLGSDEEYIK